MIGDISARERDTSIAALMKQLSKFVLIHRLSEISIDQSLRRAGLDLGVCVDGVFAFDLGDVAFLDDATFNGFDDR